MPDNQVNVFVQGPSLEQIETLAASPIDSIDQVVSQLLPSDIDHAKQRIFLEDLPVPIRGDLIVEDLLPLSPDGAVFEPLRLHVTRCQSIAVSVRFNGATRQRHFAPGVTIERVRRWAARRAFGLPHRDAGEHVLQLCANRKRPDTDIHVGVLVDDHCGSVEFDLVPQSRVEG